VQVASQYEVYRNPYDISTFALVYWKNVIPASNPYIAGEMMPLLNNSRYRDMECMFHGTEKVQSFLTAPISQITIPIYPIGAFALKVSFRL
jgi:hypothetical protein